MLLEHVCPDCGDEYTEDWDACLSREEHEGAIRYIEENTPCPQCSAVRVVLKISEAIRAEAEAEKSHTDNPIEIERLRALLAASSEFKQALAATVFAADRLKKAARKKEECDESFGVQCKVRYVVVEDDGRGVIREDYQTMIVDGPWTWMSEVFGSAADHLTSLLEKTYEIHSFSKATIEISEIEHFDRSEGVFREHNRRR